MKVSADGIKKLIAREGAKTTAYRDSVGIWTIGVGHTAAAGPPVPKKGMKITAQQVQELLMKDIVQYEDAVNKSVKVPLTQGQFDALVSMVFNIGPAGWRKSTCLKKLNTGDYEGAAKAMLLWNKPPEIQGRRKQEYNQFLAATQSAPRRRTTYGLVSQQETVVPIDRHQAYTESAEKPVQAVDANELVAEAQSVDELKAQLASEREGLTKKDIAPDSSIMRTSLNTVKGALGTAGVTVGGVTAAALGDEQNEGFFSSLYNKLSAVPGPVYFVIILVLLAVGGFIAWYISEKRLLQAKLGETL